jgi:hypothetical protein
MARLTDNNGVLLGGLETPLSYLLSPLNETGAAAITAPAEPPLPPTYGPGEIVFALHCAYGSLPTLGYSAAPSPRRRGCDTLIEEPEERHFCPACGGYYCLLHAEPTAHECRSVRRTK